MSKLSEFLNPVTTLENQEVVISSRFIKRDENGDPVLDKDGKTIPAPFKIRALTQEENDALVKAATTSYRDRSGTKTTNFDRFRYSHSVVVAGTVEPDFRSKEVCDHFGVLDPLMVPGKMLLAGEYQKLADAIAEFSGISDIEEEVKN